MTEIQSKKHRPLHARHLFKADKRSRNHTLMMDGQDTAFRQATRSNASSYHERNRAQSAFAADRGGALSKVHDHDSETTGRI